jgi:SAM-dependent methyltransferase
MWSKIFAVVYEPSLWIGEIMGMRGRRATLLRSAAGRVVEIGAGTGLNVAHYPDGLSELVLTEPEPAMRARLARRAGDRAEVVDAPAERLPLPDGSVDTVVATLVLCTVDEPEHALREIKRILRPGGQLLFIEHVRARSTLLARWQDRMLRPWRSFAAGCHCNRPTVDLMRACGFEVAAEDAAWRGMPPLIRPLVVGRARLSASGDVRPQPAS